jgi:lysophospholipase L1-like esterase
VCRLVAAVVLAAVAAALLCSAAQPATGARTVLHYGDSLAVGTGLYLTRLLPGWRVQSSTDISRHADAGPPTFRELGAGLPRVLVVSLGTNDDPGRVSGFAAIVRETLRIAGPNRCVIWSNIVRPPYGGVSYEGYNRALAALQRRHRTLRVLDWVALTRAHPEWLGRDGVHVTAAGYRARAAATAALVRSC